MEWYIIIVFYLILPYLLYDLFDHDSITNLYMLLADLKEDDLFDPALMTQVDLLLLTILSILLMLEDMLNSCLKLSMKRIMLIYFIRYFLLFSIDLIWMMKNQIIEILTFIGFIFSKFVGFHNWVFIIMIFNHRLNLLLCTELLIMKSYMSYKDRRHSFIIMCLLYFSYILFSFYHF